MSSRLQIVFLAGLLLLMLGLSFAIVRPYIGSIVMAGSLAIVFQPLYRGIHKIVTLDSLASFISLLIIVVLVLLPIVFLGTLVFQESQGLYSTLITGQQLPDIYHRFGVFVNSFIPPQWGQLDIPAYGERVLGWMVNSLGGVFSSILQGLGSLALSIFMLFFFLKDGPRVRQFFITHSPLPDSQDAKITDRIELAVNSVMRGSLLMAGIQGLLAGIGFTFFGVPNPALWGGIAAFAALIPTIGTTLVILPAILYLLIVGEQNHAISLAIWGGLAVGMIDNVLGPRLVGSRVHLHPLIMFLSVLGGIGFFGPIGFLLGPLVVIVSFVLLDIYLETVAKTG